MLLFTFKLTLLRYFLQVRSLGLSLATQTQTWSGDRNSTPSLLDAKNVLTDNANDGKLKFCLLFATANTHTHNTQQVVDSTRMSVGRQHDRPNSTHRLVTTGRIRLPDSIISPEGCHLVTSIVHRGQQIVWAMLTRTNMVSLVIFSGKLV